MVGWRLVFIDWPNLAEGRGNRQRTRLARRSEKTVGPRRGFSRKRSRVSRALFFRPTATKLTPERWVTAAFGNQPLASPLGCQETILAANYPNTFPDKSVSTFCSLTFFVRRRLKVKSVNPSFKVERLFRERKKKLSKFYSNCVDNWKYFFCLFDRFVRGVSLIKYQFSSSFMVRKIILMRKEGIIFRIFTLSFY